MSKNQSQHGQEEKIAADQSQSGVKETEQAEDAAEIGAKNGPQDSDQGESAKNGQSPEETAAEQLLELSPEEKIAGLEAQLADTRDQLLRKAADFENFRKRMNQEKQNAIEFANQSLLLDIIPIIDDFERAIQSASSSKDFTALLDGITMIEKRLTGQLESKWGLKRFHSAGEPFDPSMHEAFMMEKSPDVSEAVVQEDLIKGYLLKERVIRAAKVKVLMPEKEGTGTGD